MTSMTALLIAIVVLTFLMVCGVPMPMAFGSAIVWIITSLGINSATVCQHRSP